MSETPITTPWAAERQLRRENERLEQKLAEAEKALRLIALRVGRAGHNPGEVADQALARLAGDPVSGSEADSPKSVPLPVVEVDG